MALKGNLLLLLLLLLLYLLDTFSTVDRFPSPPRLLLDWNVTLTRRPIPFIEDKIYSSLSLSLSFLHSRFLSRKKWNENKKVFVIWIIKNTEYSNILRREFQEAGFSNEKRIRFFSIRFNNNNNNNNDNDKHWYIMGNLEKEESLDRIFYSRRGTKYENRDHREP